MENLNFEVIGRTQDLIKNSNILYCLASPETYLTIIGNDWENFEFQRDRQNYRAYKNLKEDIKNGGVIPAITLAIKNKHIDEALTAIDDDEKLKSILLTGEYVDILDGLQRTYIINDLKTENIKFKDGQKFLLEIWFEKDITNIMKRMIVLNSSQKRMSSKHQVDLLFSTFFNEKIKNDIPEDIIIYREKNRNDIEITGKKEYPLNRIASAYYSFLNRKPIIADDKLIANLFLDDADDVDEVILGNNYDKFKCSLKTFFELNQVLFDIYHDSNKAKAAKVDEATKADEEKDSNEKWFSSDIVMSAIFAALPRISSDILTQLLNIIVENKQALPDPLGLKYFHEFKGTGSGLSKVGTFQRRLTEKFILNLLIETKLIFVEQKQDIPSSFEEAVKRSWEEAKEAV